MRFHSLDAMQLSACTPLDCGSIRARCAAAESALRLIAVFRSMRCSSGVCTPLDCGRGWGGASWQGTAWPFAAVFRHAIGRGWGWCAPGPACRALHPYAVLCVALVLGGGIRAGAFVGRPFQSAWATFVARRSLPAVGGVPVQWPVWANRGDCFVVFRSRYLDLCLPGG